MSLLVISTQNVAMFTSVGIISWFMLYDLDDYDSKKDASVQIIKGEAKRMTDVRYNASCK